MSVLNDEFISEIQEKNQQLFKDLSSPFYIEAGTSIYIFMGFCEDINKIWKNKDIKMKLLGIYNNQYKIDECLNIQHFINKLHFNVKSDVETTIDHIKKGLIIQNDSYMPIQKSIDLIAKNLNELKLYNEKTTIKCDNKNQ